MHTIITPTIRLERIDMDETYTNVHCVHNVLIQCPPTKTIAAPRKMDGVPCPVPIVSSSKKL